MPDVDFIALHGVYSWIGAEARQAVQRIIFERLKPGGLVYNSYNCLPGWAAEAPIRRLFLEFAAVEPGTSVVRMQQALRRAGELQALKLGYLARNSVADRAISHHLQQPANYMAHEYLNADWNLFYSIDVAAEMTAAKLDYVGAAHLVENHLDLLFNDEAAAFVRKQPTLALQQLMQDFLINQRFRRDIFVRGHARLGRAAIAAQLRQQCFLPVKPLAEVGAKLKVPRGDVSFEGDIPAILAKAFGGNALSLAELTEAYRQAGGKPSGLERIVGILAATGIVAPAIQPQRPAKAYAPPARLRLQTNQHLLQQAMGRLGRNAGNMLLVAPVLGGAIPVSPVNTVILSEMLTGGTEEDLAGRSMASIERHGLALQTEGEMGVDSAAKRAQLAGMIRNFAETDLGLLLESGAVDIA